MLDGPSDNEAHVFSPLDIRNILPKPIICEIFTDANQCDNTFDLKKFSTFIGDCYCVNYAAMHEYFTKYILTLT